MYNSPVNVRSSNDTPYPLINHHHHHNQPIMIPVPSLLPYPGGGGDENEFPRRDERFLQWSNQETREFIEIRAQLEWEFNSSKRNKNLWETVANRMGEKGYRRTVDQCKCKWKNLVSKYKGVEAFDLDNVPRCPFFDKMHAVFTASANTKQQAQLNSGTLLMEAKNKRQKVPEYQSQEEFSLEPIDKEETDADQARKRKFVPETKSGKEKRQKTAQQEKNSSSSAIKDESVISLLKETLGNFFQQQQMIDMQWRELTEKRAQERELFEHEWRQTMEKLERERLNMEQARREREEQWKLREESRAEKRDELLNMLLNNLFRDENP